MRISNKGWIVLSTLVLIILAFMFYFLVYVKNKEKEIIEDNYRVLTQMTDNIDQVLEGVKRQVETKIVDKGGGVSFDSIAVDFNAESLKVFVPGDSLYKEFSYPDLFKNDLIERKDVFDFIAISHFKDGALEVIYTNRKGGSILSFGDTITQKSQLKEVFPINLGISEFLTFNTSLRKESKTEVILTGFISQERMNDMKRQVSVFFLSLSIIITVFILIGLPLIKLKVMSTFERLYIRDVSMTGISLVVGSSILVIMLIFFINNFYEIRSHVKDDLKNLNSAIAKSFKNELDVAIDQMIKLDKIEELKYSTEFDIKEEQHHYKTSPANPILNDNFNYFNSIFWADSKGNLLKLITFEKDPKKIPNLSHRKYVTGPITGKGIKYSGGKIPAYIESIRSVTDGNYEIGMGAKTVNDTLPVMATSFSSATVMEPVLREGYGFCIFNSTGKTILHSEISRNLNENFLLETDNQLTSYIASSDEQFLIVPYHRSEYFIYVQPLENFQNLYLATFVSRDNVNTPNTIALAVTFISLLGYFVLIYLIYVLINFFTRNSLRLKQQFFLFNWLRPFISDPVAFRRNFIFLIIINLISLVFMICFWLLVPEAALLLYNILFINLLTVLTHYFILSPQMPYQKNLNISNKTYRHIYYKVMALFILIWLVTKINIYRSIEFESGVKLISFDVILSLFFLIAFILTIRSRAYKKRQINIKQKYSFKLYYLFLTTCMLIISIIPTLSFYSVFQSKEILIQKQFSNHKYEKRKASWDDKKISQYELNDPDKIGETTLRDVDVFIENMKVNRLDYKNQDSSWVNQNTSDLFQPHFSNIFNQLYKIIRIKFNEYSSVTTAFTGKNSIVSSSKSDVKGITFSGFISSFGNSALIIISGIIIIVFFIHNLNHFACLKIFGLDFKNYADNLVPRQKLGYVAERLKVLFNQNTPGPNSFNNTMLTGVNASHIFEIRNNFKSWKNDEFYCLDFLELKNLNLDPLTLKLNAESLSLFFKEDAKRTKSLELTLDEKTGDQDNWIMIFIEHFEFGYNDLEFNKIKLRILERLVDNPNIRVIISSEISPAKIYDFYEGSIRRLEGSIKKGDDAFIEKRNEIARYKIDYKMWLHLLGGFYRLTIPFEYNSQFESNNKLLKAELDHGRYLFKINEAFKKGPLNNDISPEHQILLIQEIAYPYYFSIWNSLTKEERYTVYDIAKDKFVNTNNVDGIIDLLHKGVLVYDHSLRLMNESFTNFVLSKVDSDEALARELEKRKGGLWSTTSTVLFLVVISLIVFISFGEVSFLNDINALIGSLAAVFTLILRIGGIFTFGKPNG
ncbi:cache domain-containing protein [Mangrovivirga sp. M17]|uniref:Cache domain-containing protein n=1 Tax=Mangrovivirga halotolerans TaxID=2993936 RepID=A0ABT3RS48_9BACT|nr:cache domain-containing protein [Mangrovivirga halotolerans]MCX2744174.1 cache domain-containing protein [Mangrovivirga halotolerans]